MHHVVGRDEMATGGGVIRGIANLIGASAQAISIFLVDVEHGSCAGGILVVGVAGRPGGGGLGDSGVSGC